MLNEVTRAKTHFGKPKSRRNNSECAVVWPHVWSGKSLLGFSGSSLPGGTKGLNCPTPHPPWLVEEEVVSEMCGHLPLPLAKRSNNEPWLPTRAPGAASASSSALTGNEPAKCPSAISNGSDCHPGDSPPWGHLATSGDIFGYRDRGSAFGIYREAAKHPTENGRTAHRTHAHQKHPATPGEGLPRLGTVSAAVALKFHSPCFVAMLLLACFPWPHLWRVSASVWEARTSPSTPSFPSPLGPRTC